MVKRLPRTTSPLACLDSLGSRDVSGVIRRRNPWLENSLVRQLPLSTPLNPFRTSVAPVGIGYEYAAQKGKAVTIQACELPEAIANRCKELAVAMDLHVIGVDLRCTPDRQWYCFEVNTSPGFTYFQQATNQPMDEAIAKLLASFRKELKKKQIVSCWLAC